MAIRFSQNLIKYLPVYLNTSLGEISKDKDFHFSRVYVYKLAEGTAQVSDAVNEAFNKYWVKMEMTSEDLENIYSLIDLIEAGRNKEKQFKLKEHQQQHKKEGSK